MPRFLFVNQSYGPDSASTGQHLSDLTEHLVSHGHQVRVLSAVGNVAPQKGVQVRWLRSSLFGRPSRMAGYVGFHARVAPRLLFGRWADVVVTLTTPPLLGLWGSLARRLGGPRHVAFLMDHHPDAEYELGLLARDSWLGRSVGAAYGWALRHADQCVSLGSYQDRRTAAWGARAERRSVIPIWNRSDRIRFTPEGRRALRERFDWNGRFVVLYSGNIGWVHCFEELQHAMLRLADSSPHVLFAFVGRGPRRRELEEFVRSKALENARFLEAVPIEELNGLLSAADAHFVSLRPEHVGVSVPSKLYGQLASQRPVLFVGPEDCESADDLRAAGAGRCLAPGDGEGLARAIAELEGDPELCRAMGERGRRWFVDNRDWHLSCERWRHMLESLVAETDRSPEELAA